MKPPLQREMKMKRMKENSAVAQTLHEEFAKFETTMQEIHFLKLVADDLRSYRRMIQLKRYD
jgi:hypothetical protein